MKNKIEMELELGSDSDSNSDSDSEPELNIEMILEELRVVRNHDKLQLLETDYSNFKKIGWDYKSLQNGCNLKKYTIVFEYFKIGGKERMFIKDIFRSDDNLIKVLNLSFYGRANSPQETVFYKQEICIKFDSKWKLEVFESNPI